MVRLEQIDVEGFKGIDSLQFEPGAINVVTGRNNSGKTSLLEAINIALQPDRIGNFGSNLSTLINYRCERSTIDVRGGNVHSKLHLSELPEGRVFEVLSEVFQQHTYDALQSVEDVEMEHEALDSEIPEVLREQLSNGTLEDVRDEILLTSVNDQEYPYVYFGPSIGELFNEMMEVFLERTDLSYQGTINRDEFQTDLGNFAIYSALVSRPKGLFVGGQPDAVGSVNLIDFAQLSNSLDLPEDDADPVKIDNIGDFLRENDIVDNLKTFDLDDLVFEDKGGEKYSVPFSFMGEGFKSIVGVLWELFDEDELEDVVLLEEPETHMHPGYVRELIYFLIQVVEEADVQLFITTHNNDFLNDFFTENLTDDERTFLSEEFKLLQLQDGVADVMTYAEAEAQLKDLQLDLRGI